MPIPPDVGAAIVAYLRDGRPKSSCRRLFLRTLAPHVGFASGCAITMIAKTALERAGIQGYAHQGRPYLPAQPRHRASPLRRNLVGDRPAAAAREPRHHADLREGRHRGAPDIEPAVAGRRAMTDLRSALERYLSMRQGARIQVPAPDTTARRLRLLHGEAQGHDHHHEAGDGVGDIAARSACILGVAADRRARLRAPCREHRSEDGGATRRHPAGLEACQALCLQRRGDRCVAGGGAGPAASRTDCADGPTTICSD